MSKESQTNQSETKQEPDENDDLAWRIAQLATSLLPPTVQSTAKGWVWAEDYFTEQVDGAIHKARVILDRASRSDFNKFHLHEYFTPGEHLNARQITDKLTDIRWLSREMPTIIDRLKIIENEWTRQLKQMKSNFLEIQDRGQKSLVDLEKLLDVFCKQEGVVESLPRAAELSRNLLSELGKGLLFSEEEKQTVEYHRHKRLFDWCFIVEGKNKSGKASKRRYRFHELLRVADDHGWLPKDFMSPDGAISPELPPYYAIPKRSSFAVYNEDGVICPLTSYPW